MAFYARRKAAPLGIVGRTTCTNTTSDDSDLAALLRRAQDRAWGRGRGKDSGVSHPVNGKFNVDQTGIAGANTALAGL